MRMFVLTLATCGLVLVAATAQDAKKDARAIDVKGLKAETPRGDATKPAKIASDKELAEAIPDKDWQKKIGKEVDFAKEYLLYFTWSGSGGDKLSPATVDEKGKVAIVFTYERGLTRDLRPHVHLYALPKDATWRMGDKK